MKDSVALRKRLALLVLVLGAAGGWWLLGARQWVELRFAFSSASVACVRSVYLELRRSSGAEPLARPDFSLATELNGPTPDWVFQTRAEDHELTGRADCSDGSSKRLPTRRLVVRDGGRFTIPVSGLCACPLPPE